MDKIPSPEMVLIAMGKKAKKPKRTKKQKEGLYSKITVSLLISSNVIVMGACLWLIDRTGIEAAALAGLWFGWTTAELKFLKDIKTKKENVKVKERELTLKYNDEAEESED